MIVGEELCLRGEHYLYCIAEDGDDEWRHAGRASLTP